MTPIVRALLACVASFFRSRVSLQLEILAVRHHLALNHRSSRRPPVQPSDRLLWSWLARGWSHWRAVLVFVQPAPWLAWQRTRFRTPWAHRRRTGSSGRPTIRGGGPHGSWANWEAGHCGGESHGGDVARAPSTIALALLAGVLEAPRAGGRRPRLLPPCRRSASRGSSCGSSGCPSDGESSTAVEPRLRPPSGRGSSSSRPFPGRPLPSTCSATAMPCPARDFSGASRAGAWTTSSPPLGAPGRVRLRCG